MGAPGEPPHEPAAVSAADWAAPAVVAATCGWIGRIPFAPGTWGAAAGIPLALALHAGATWLAPRLLPGVAAGVTLVEAALVGIVCLAGVPLCAAAARRLGGADPGPIVYDELASMPLVLLGVPAAARTPAVLLLAFVLLRVFDIAKPFPCRRLERLPGGLGIMADDWGAAALAAGCLALARWQGWA